MAENSDGGEAIPYYHSAYDELVQETPYSFKKPEELTDPANIDAELRAQPRPGHGAAVPDQPLGRHLAGAEAVERRQGQRRARRCSAGSTAARSCAACSPNLIAVDFYRQGDLFEAIAELNAERGLEP